MIPVLADRYRVVAPDYVQDYGAPVGYRLAVAHPQRVTAIVVQNGNVYDLGLENDFWKPIKAYWKEPGSREKRDALRSFLTYELSKATSNAFRISEALIFVARL